MPDYSLAAGPFNVEDGRLCLDFANTAEWHASAHPTESLNSYADLVQWGQKVGILPGELAQRLLGQAEKSLAQAWQALDRAVTLREAIYRICAGAAHGRSPDKADLAILNAILPQALSALRVAADNGGFAWSWTVGDDALDCILWPIARDAADLLTSAELGRVGQCADDRGCGWLFIDTSRNRSRRWCSIEGCGNRAKAKRHYERTRKSKT